MANKNKIKHNAAQKNEQYKLSKTLMKIFLMLAPLFGIAFGVYYVYSKDNVNDGVELNRNELESFAKEVIIDILTDDNTLKKLSDKQVDSIINENIDNIFSNENKSFHPIKKPQNKDRIQHIPKIDSY